ncbi:MAG TPA: hypothetical protein VLK84_05075, partial [Longimicrobium sp.]|nr:hypothetical protein [Longimicrobium sp.]
MRYAALLAASAAVAVLTLPREGRSEFTPAAQAPAARAIPAALQSGQEDFRWSGRIARGDEIEVRGLLGDVRAEPSSGDQVEVVGHRIGGDGDQVRIEVVETDDGVTICAIYPRTGGSSSRDDDPCNDGESGQMNLDKGGARIDFTVRVPAGVRLAARTVQGDIHATGLRGPVDATCVDGDVIVRLTGDMGAEVNASTLAGNIQSDFALRMRGKDGEEDDNRFNIQI